MPAPRLRSVVLDTSDTRAHAVGVPLLPDRGDDPEEALSVVADPAGHPFCIVVA